MNNLIRSVEKGRGIGLGLRLGLDADFLYSGQGETHGEVNQRAQSYNLVLQTCL